MLHSFHKPKVSLPLWVPLFFPIGFFPIGFFGTIGFFLGTIGFLDLTGATYANDPPALMREFRGAWVATVANIDWPSQPGLTTQQQQQELITLVDRAAALHFNAIVFQVRPAADALYASELEPWSEYLTGQMGQPPEPFYDPLTFAIDAAHERGLELHAWFNPYRALHPAGKSQPSTDHVSHRMPQAVRSYGKYLWLDPGDTEAVDHSLAVILDVVRRYDIDGVHFDDYFYPYPIKDEAGKPVSFPDDRSWKAAQKAGNRLDRDDWRRQNVDHFIERTYGEIQQVKPWVRFGISPFGIWKPGIPKSIRGFNAYASLYADARKWTREGWLDYITPQLYWEVESKGQSYPVLLQWWHQQNIHGRHLWPGNFTSRVGLKDRLWPAAEIIRQIETTRKQVGASGNIHFSFQAIQKNQGRIADALIDGPYAQAALVPATPWLNHPIPAQPVCQLKRDDGSNSSLHMRLPNGDRPWLWAIQTRRNDQWEQQIVPGLQDMIILDHSAQSATLKQIVVTPISRTGVAGPGVEVLVE